MNNINNLQKLFPFDLFDIDDYIIRLKCRMNDSIIGTLKVPSYYCKPLLDIRQFTLYNIFQKMILVK